MKFRSFPFLFIFSFLSVTFFCCEEGTKLSADKKIDQLVLTVGGTDTPVTFDSDYNAVLTVPFGTDLTAITVKTLQVSAKATASVAQGDVLTLTGGSATLTVTAEDGSKQVYTVQVTDSSRTGAAITALTATIAGQAYSTTGANPAVVITGNAIAITLPFGSTLPTVLSLTVLTLSPGASSAPAEGATLDLTAGVGTINVTAEDGVTMGVYTVQVTIANAPRMGVGITALTATIANQAYSTTGDNPAVAITGSAIAITLPFGSTLPTVLSLTVLTLSPGASSAPVEGATLSLTAGAGMLTVTAEDGITIGIYNVQITMAPPPLTGAAITALTATIAGQAYSTTGDNPAVVITDNTIAIMLPFNIDLPSSLLLTVLTLSPGASSTPVEGATLALTAAGVGTITVTAEDGVTMGVYTVQVTIALARTGAAMTALTATIAGQAYSTTGDNPLITIMNNAIAITLPLGSVLPSSLSLTTLSLSPGASSVPAEGTTLNLSPTGVGMLTVTAENGMAMRVYTVRVTIAVVPLTGVSITALTVTTAGQTYSTVGNNAPIVITGNAIAITLPFGSTLPTVLSLTVLTLSPGASSVPAEGTTLNLVAGTGAITVTAEDGTTRRVYAVRVTITPPLTGVSITALTATIAGQAYSSVGNNAPVVITDNAIAITLPVGSTLPTSLSLTVLTLSPRASSVPAEGTTLNLAAGTGTITVTAEDGTTMRVYAVRVEIVVPLLTGVSITALTATIAGQAYSSVGNNAPVVIMGNAIAITLPFGSTLPTSLSLTVLTLSPRASSVPAEGTTLNLAAGTGTITVTAEDGVTMRVYAVRVTMAAPLLTGVSITALTATIAGQTYSSVGNNAPVVITGNAVAITLPVGSTLPTSLSITVLTLSPGASSVPAEGTTLNLTAGTGTITVTAEDGVTRRVYAVRVTIALRTGAAITALTATISGQSYSSTGANPAVVITGNTISLMVTTEITPFGSLLPVNVTLLTLSPGASSTFSEGDALDLTATGVGSIIVQAEDPTVAAVTYTITVSIINTAEFMVTTYTNTDTLGIAVRDVVTEAGRSLSFAAMDAVIMVSGLANVSFNWALGTLRGTKTATAGTLVLTQSDLGVFPAMADVSYVLTVSANGQTSAGKMLFYYPGQLRTWRDLQGVRVDLAGMYRLMNDISFSDEDGDGVSEYNFEPLGRAAANTANSQDNDFSGTFDGANHEIRNLYINRRAEDYVGLFVTITGTVSNLGLAGGTVMGRNYVGVLAGTNNSGTVQNVYATGAVTGNNFIGGFMGFGNGGTLRSVYATGAVTATGFSVGGLVGISSGMIQRAYATGVVTANEGTIGGLVGTNSGMIQGAYATGTVSARINSAGGLVGINSNGTITGAYATGAVTGRGIVGGLVGDNTGGTITGAYATGAVTGERNAGGLVGRNRNNGNLRGYAHGNVTRTAGSTATTFGRLVGDNSGTATGYYSSQTGESQLFSAAANANPTPLTDATGFEGTARTSASVQADFANFDFTTNQIGQWIYTAGRWPALNLGGLQSAAEQPTQ